MASLSNINGLFDVHSTGAILFSDEHGTTGQILRSNGDAAPTWIDFSSTGFGGDYLLLTGGVLTGNLTINGTNNLTVGGTLTVNGITTLNDHLKVFNAWSSSDLTQNSFYAQNATDGFAFGVGSDVSTWFSYDSTAGIGVKPAIHVYNNASEIKIGVSDQPITMVSATTFSSSVTGTTGTFTGLVSGITPTADLNFATKKYVDDGRPDPGVTQITAGTNVTITPVGGTGNVTINANTQGDITALTLGNGLTGTNLTGPIPDILMSGTYTGDYTITGTLTSGAATFTDNSVVPIKSISSTYAGIEFLQTSATWELYIGTETGAGNARYNSRQGVHTWYSNSTQTMQLSSAGALTITDDLSVGDSARFEGTTNPITIGDGFGYGGSATICKHNSDIYLQYNNGQTATNLQIGGGGTAVAIKDAQNGGFQITGNGVTYFTGGNVGISTTTPQSILSLSKTDEASYTPATAIDYSLMLGTRNGNAAGTSDDLGPGIVWKYNDSGGSYTKKSAGIMQVGEGNYLRSGLAFYTNDNADQTTAWSEKMRLSMDGNFGIGMTTPASKLQFSSNNHAADPGGKDYTGSAINADGGDVATGRIFFQGYQNGGTDLCGINNETSRVVLYNYTDTRYLQYWDHAGSSFIPNGSLGIGNTSASYNLDVTGTGRFTNKLYAYSLDTRLVPNSTWAYVLSTSAASGTNDSGFWVNSDGSPDMRLRRLDGTVRTLFNSNTSDSYINNGGSLGIGNNAPGYKLDVNGTGNFSSYLKLANAWSSSTLSANSFYVQNTTDGFAMGVGTGISSWFSWSNTAGQKRAIDLDNDGNYILVGAGGQNVQIQGTTVPLAPLSVDNNAIRMGRDWAIANRADIRLDSNGPSNPADILYGHTAAANQGSWTGVYWALSSRGSSASNRFYFYRGGGQPAPYSGEAVIMSFDPALRVGINQVAPAYALDVTGTIRATGDVIAYSDARIKDNVKTIDNALEKTAKLRGVSYTRNDIEDKSTKIGVIAQEVLEVLPEVVSKDDEGKYSVSYGNIVGVLIEAIKELEARVKELENK